MEFYDVIDKRRTTREFLKKEVDFEIIRRILEAGNKAPTWDHNRNWQYIILRTEEEKEYAFEEAKKIAGKFDAPYVIIPLFKAKELNGEYVSKLNPFATIWCVIENIFLAAAAEGLSCSMRIPLNKEHDIVKAKLKVPPTYMIPVFIGIGYPDPDEPQLEQYKPDLDKQIRFGRWK